LTLKFRIDRESTLLYLVPITTFGKPLSLFVLEVYLVLALYRFNQYFFAIARRKRQFPRIYGIFSPRNNSIFGFSIILSCATSHRTTHNSKHCPTKINSFSNCSGVHFFRQK